MAGTMGMPTDFAAFAQGNQDGSGAPGFGPAGSPATSQDRSRARTRPGDDDMGYVRVPANSPRPSPYGESSTASVPQNMEQMFQQFLRYMVQAASGETPSTGARGMAMKKGQKVILEDKYFNRVKPFSGDSRKKDEIDYRTLIFDLIVAIGKIDGELGKELKTLLGKSIRDDWDPREDPDVDMGTHERYSEELFSVLVGLTEGDAKGIVRSLVDRGLPQDGYRALIELNRRYDYKTAASLLHAFMAVVNPDKIQRVEDVQKRLAIWEGSIAKLKSRYGEDVSGKIKMAIFVGMLPKELQDLVLQNSAMTSDDIPYEKNS